MTSEMAFGDLYKRIEYLAKFNEGTEIGDIVREAAVLARMLLDDRPNCIRVILVAEDYARLHCEELKHRGCSWEEYDEFDSDCYTWFLGGAKKLTKEQFDG